MLLIPCPHCGARPEIEFRYAGQAHLRREIDPLRLDDTGWIQLLYFRSNTRGVHAERWRHQHGCGRFFNALRDTVSDKFLTSYAIGTTAPAVAPHSGEAQ